MVSSEKSLKIGLAEPPQPRDKRRALKQVGETETWSLSHTHTHTHTQTQLTCKPSTIGRDFKNTEQEICVLHQASKLLDFAQEIQAPRRHGFENQKGLHSKTKTWNYREKRTHF